MNPKERKKKSKVESRLNPFTEDNLVEQTVIKLIKELWADEACHINAYTDAEDAKLGREHRGEVVLKKFLVPALEKLNPDLPADAIHQAVEQLTRDRSHLTWVNANHEICELLRDGASVNAGRADGGRGTDRARFFDFENPSRQSLFVYHVILGCRRNVHPQAGRSVLCQRIPLMLLELKAPQEFVDAYRGNIRDYKNDPKLLWYNMGIIISNGIETSWAHYVAI